MLRMACKYQSHFKIINNARLFRKSNKYSTLTTNLNSASNSYLTFSSCRYIGRSCTAVWHDRTDDPLPPISWYAYQRRGLHLNQTRYENNSSKVDETVKTLKNKQKEKVEEIMKEVASGSSTAAGKDLHKLSSGNVGDLGKVSDSTKAVAPKKSIGTRIWEELVHYYHGFRLLFIDIGVSGRLLWRVLNGKTLTRRENKLLQRTSADIFRLIPFSVFIIVPFMELLLPIFIKLFPNMLPSTFTTAKEHEDKLKQAMTVKLEMAKFLQKTLDEMPAQHKDHKSEEAKNFEMFYQKIKDPQAYVSNEEIIKFAKRFNDEITLDSLSREQLAALCRMLELNTIGTSSLLRFQLRVKLRSLAADDRVIARESVESLDLFELQQACKARGMRAYGLTEEKLRAQLKEWIDLSLNEKVPPTLLLLSRTMHSYDDNITTDKLKQILRELPDSAAQQTKAAIGECEGKVDNKTKIEVIKQEEKKIQEERDEEREERIEISAQNATDNTIQPQTQGGQITQQISEAPCAEISRTDVQLLSDALKTLSDKTMCVEKETIKEIKEELQEYKDDVEELCEVGKVVQEPIKERRGAKLLYKKVNSMIDQLDTVLNDLEKKKEQEIKKTDFISPGEKERVQIDQLVQTVRKLRENTEESQFKQLETLLSKLDGDKDGLITAEEVSQFIKSLPKSCPHIDSKHYAELADQLNKQAVERRHQELVRIDELMHNIKMIKETSTETRVKHIEKVLEKLDDDKDGVITVNEVLKVVESLGRENVKLSEKQIEELVKLIEKEEVIEAEERIEKALAKSEREKAKSKINETTKAQIVEALAHRELTFTPITTKLDSTIQDDVAKNQKIKSSSKIDDTLVDRAPMLKDKATDLNKLEDEKEKLKRGIRAGNSMITAEALKRQDEKLMSKGIPNDISTSSSGTPSSYTSNAATLTKSSSSSSSSSASSTIVPPTTTTPAPPPPPPPAKVPNVAPPPSLRSASAPKTPTDDKRL